MSELRGNSPLPTRPFPLMPLRTGVLLPGTVVALPVGRPRSLALLQAVREGEIIGVVAQRDARVDDPGRDELRDVGTFVRVVDVTKVAGGNFRVTLEALGRLRLTEVVEGHDFLRVHGDVWPDVVDDPSETRRLAQELMAELVRLGGAASGLAPLLRLDPEADPGLFADRVAASIGLAPDKEQQVLEEARVAERLVLVKSLLGQTKAQAEVAREIDAEVRRGIGKGQREAILREQLRAIQRELGEDSQDSEVEALRTKLAGAKLSEEAKTVADRELKRLSALNPQQPEFNVIRTYLEWIAELPWETRAGADDKLDLEAIEGALARGHYGLEDVKKRVLEHMAVLSLAGHARASILCLAGPPGVGKTSIAQSIADATGRPMVRISLGGVSDEAELRGHRRTYVAALPGRIIHALRKVKAKNPVIVLDEIDKLGQTYRGSPESALLELLDPEQNKNFVDHYLELPFDLSEALFVCTANELGNLSPPLRDRLEIIEIAGYTEDEKVHIAKEHLLPKKLADHGLPASSIALSDGALEAIVREYTREAGVRQLGRELGKLCRAVSVQLVRAKDEPFARIHVEASELSRWLGRPRFHNEVVERTSAPGVAMGLAWTPVGGDVLFIETTRMPGKGGVEITGQLGDVMRESARAALSYVRGHAEVLGVDVDRLALEDLHIHVPAGGVPKDGPSAGVTMFTALTSLLTGRKVRSDTAMTGECTLRGRVLPVGGIKSKVLAAQRAGLTRIILPRRNERDLDDVPADVRSKLEFVLVDWMEEVLAAALEESADASVRPRSRVTTGVVSSAMS